MRRREESGRVEKVEVMRTFPAQPRDVWAMYTDHAGWNRWSGLKHSSLESEGAPDPNGPGAVRCLGSYGFNAFEEILEFEPPQKMTYRVVKGGLPMKNHLGEVLFEAAEGGTRITWRCRFESKVPGLGLFMRLYVGWFFRAALEGMARHLASR